MSSLNEIKYASLSKTTGHAPGTKTLNELEWEWLSSQTGLTDRSLAEMWAALLISMGNSGTVREMQMRAWGMMGYTGDWNERAFQYWSGGGTFGPTAVITALDAKSEPICKITPPATTCKAYMTFKATDFGFVKPPVAATYKWVLHTTAAGTIKPAIVGSSTSQEVRVETTSGDAEYTFRLELTVTRGAESASHTMPTVQDLKHNHHEDVLTIGGDPVTIGGVATTV